MARTPFGKTREVEKPYAIYHHGDWEWRVLKTYQHPDKEKTNQYARWFVAAKSPMTYGSWEYGDTYASEIKQYGHLSLADDGWLEHYGESA